MGCVYACAWGPACMRVHDAFDLMSEATTEDSVVMTTSHEHDSLEGALTFLARDALPSEGWIDSCRTSLVAVVGNEEWAAQAASYARRLPSAAS